MTEYLFKSSDGSGDVAVSIAQTKKEALANLQKHYPKCKFDLINEYCLDCE